MLKVGLTGGIGSGKSVVADVFKIAGIPVFDADKAAKTIMETDQLLIASIKSEFGEESYTDGKLNRPYLANLVFNDAYKVERLNLIVHPPTIAAANKWMNEQHSPYIIKEAALLFESGSASQVDYVIGVSAPQPIRIKRAMHRDKLGREEVLARINRQIDENIKMKLCDFVIVNDEQNLLISQVLRLHEKFLTMTLL